MPLEIGLWRVTDRATQLAPSKMPYESRLEQLILDDPAILETELLILGHQVLTSYGKFIDILGIDVEGSVHIIELKRDRTPREVVAQALDYASWVQLLSNDDVREIFQKHHPEDDFDVAFSDRFGGTPTPDDLNEAHSITIVASDLDDSTERIVQYLSGSYSVPINVMLFRYFADQGNSYLARTWLIEDAHPDLQSAGGKRASSKAPWNGRDWYVAFGLENNTRNWLDARTYGFVSAGGGEWYSRSLRKLPVGARVFVCIPGSGYVGVGTVAGPASPARVATLGVNGVQTRFVDLDLHADYGLDSGESQSDGSDLNEYVVPVIWDKTVNVADAFWKKGLFANQNSACKLRHELTISEVARAFQLETA
ncbi:endonuclease NucS domain-containing protein [Paenarthrobacter sp. AB444]|uniref:endonuclease NucS domain-containing protein n=1 Tax=Paenarthrobacter sp. AB444 TaxID=3025681 RepID=UPI0023652153|nr:endonuclease NucS domain-containing protein [Paenarthrobacter sp. AB444]MDD7836421.1 endonuclease NucS [Paenarthrobacter sp. AB444]